jgi:molybdate/tungstate transport system substrate-binding protein
MGNKSRFVTIFSAFLFLATFKGCHQQDSKKQNETGGDLVIFHAGSLAVPFKALADSFNVRYPEIKIKSESAGSLASIRKITDLNRPCDILASADYSLIDKLMIPKFASWNIQFAGNEMVLAYNKNSLKQELTNENWYALLLDARVRYGRSDPNSDPCGYRSILTLKLAEKYYNAPGLTNRFLQKDNRYIRPKEVDLLALLESGTIDCIFIYKSVAMQHHLPYLKLPDSINLGNPKMEEVYRQVSVEVAGNKPGETILQHGEPMIYGITIPKNSEHSRAAELFVRFLLTDGGEILEAMGQSMVIPVISGDTSLLPEPLKPFIK